MVELWVSSISREIDVDEDTAAVNHPSDGFAARYSSL